VTNKFCHAELSSFCYPERYASLHALATKNVSGSSSASVLTSALYLLNSSFYGLSLNYLFKGIVVVLLFENKQLVK
jgi:hypothetical protein